MASLIEEMFYMDGADVGSLAARRGCSEKSTLEFQKRSVVAQRIQTPLGRRPLTREEITAYLSGVKWGHRGYNLMSKQVV